MPPPRLTSTLALLLLVSLCAAQSYPAAGTYELASPTSFRNGSAFFEGNSALTVTEGLLEIVDNEVDIIIQLRIEAGGSEVLFTTGGQIGIASSGKIVLSLFSCTENILSGGGVGFSLCAVAQQANGCSNTLNWGQGTTNAPFANRTLIVMDGLCGIVGTQLWQCGSVGACNAASNPLPALPIGEYLLYGERPAFVLDNPQAVIPALINSSLTVQNSYEHLIIFDFQASAATVTVKLTGAAVIDTTGELLFSYSACSQANQGGPVVFQLCNVLDTEFGCESSVADAQIDVDPPENVTAILLGNAWCSFSGTFNYLCTGTCEGPVRNGAAAALGIDAGNCLQFDGNVINFDSTEGGCSISGLNVSNLYVSFATFNEIQVTEMQVTYVEVTEQTVINQTVVNQTVENQIIIEQTVVNQNVTNLYVTNIIANETAEFLDLTVTRNLFLGGSTTPFYFSSRITTYIMSFDDIGLPLFGNQGCLGPPVEPPSVPSELPVEIVIQRVGNYVSGYIDFGPMADAGLGNCYAVAAQATSFGTPTSAIPAVYRPVAEPVSGPHEEWIGNFVSPTGPGCQCDTQLIVSPTGSIRWMAVRRDAEGTDTCCQDDGQQFGFFLPSNRANILYYFGSYPNILAPIPGVTNPSNVDQYSFSYMLNV